MMMILWCWMDIMVVDYYSLLDEDFDDDDDDDGSNGDGDFEE